MDCPCSINHPVFLGLEPPIVGIIPSNHRSHPIKSSNWSQRVESPRWSSAAEAFRESERQKNSGGFINPTKNCDFIWCCMALYGFIWFYMVFWVFTMFIILLYLPFHLCSGSIMGYDMILRDFTNKVRGYQQKQTGWPPPVISWFITPSIVSYTIVTIVIIKLANELGPNPERNMRFH